MQIFNSLRRRFRRPHRGALLALLALCIGWTLALAHVAQLTPDRVALDSHDSTRVHIDAELRVGEPVPRPVADVADAQGSLHALNTRARFPSASARYRQPHFNSHPFARNASAGWLAPGASSLPLRLLARAHQTSGDGSESTPHRTIARSWPLPRSSCSDSDPDADAARRS